MCGALVTALAQSAMFGVAFALGYRGGDGVRWQQHVVLGMKMAVNKIVK
jgi:hypothetical protein